MMTMTSSPFSLLSKLCPLVLAEKMKLEDAERSLAILTRLATNAECINPIMEGITSFILGLLSLADPNHDAFLDKAITDLFNQIIKVGGGRETAVFHLGAQNDDNLLMVAVHCAKQAFLMKYHLLLSLSLFPQKKPFLSLFC